MSNVTITQEEYDQLLQAKAFQESAVGKVLVDEGRYEQLKLDSAFLSCLESAGVDNWPGYEDAQEEYRNTEGENYGQ